MGPCYIGLGMGSHATSALNYSLKTENVLLLQAAYLACQSFYLSIGFYSVVAERRSSCPQAAKVAQGKFLCDKTAGSLRVPLAMASSRIPSSFLKMAPSPNALTSAAAQAQLVQTGRVAKAWEPFPWHTAPRAP